LAGLIEVYYHWNVTKGAIDEVNHGELPPVDLIDGEQLADNLKELELGVKNELV